MASLLDRVLVQIRNTVASSGLSERIPRWFQLCSAMDTIEDIELAFDWHLEHLDERISEGELYLITYGLLQALAVQQDAVKNLACVLDQALREHQCASPHDDAGRTGAGALERFASTWDIPRDQFKNLEYIRDVRSRSTGHPTESRQRKPRDGFRFGFISRQSISTRGFSLTTIDSHDEPQQEEVDLVAWIEKQRRIFEPTLQRILEALSCLAEKGDPD